MWPPLGTYTVCCLKRHCLLGLQTYNKQNGRNELTLRELFMHLVMGWAPLHIRIRHTLQMRAISIILACWLQINDLPFPISLQLGIAYKTTSVYTYCQPGDSCDIVKENLSRTPANVNKTTSKCLLKKFLFYIPSPVPASSCRPAPSTFSPV